MATQPKSPKAKLKFDPSTYEYPECREQHIWRPYDGTVDEKAHRAYRVQKCRGCGTKRYSTLYYQVSPELDGQHVKSPTYSYPEDYQVEGGMDRLDRGRLRIHNFLEELK